MMSEEDVDRILTAAWQAGIRAFDTSEAYGLAAPRLAGWLIERHRLPLARVVTKVQEANLSDAQHVLRATERFRGALSVTVLSHGAVTGSAWTSLQRSAERLGIGAGQSVYEAREVTCASDLGAVLVQAPGNVLDLDPLDAAHAARVPLDVRSVFLQGVLLEAPASAERRVPGVGPMTAEIQSAAAAVDLRPAAALLAGMVSLLGLDDRLVLGVDDPQQFDEIREGLEAPADRVADFVAGVSAIRKAALTTPEILDPRTWP